MRDYKAEKAQLVAKAEASVAAFRSKVADMRSHHGQEYVDGWFDGMASDSEPGVFGHVSEWAHAEPGGDHSTAYRDGFRRGRREVERNIGAAYER